MKVNIAQIISDHFAKLGKKGGSKTSKAKAEAARRNAKKPRNRTKATRKRSKD